MKANLLFILAVFLFIQPSFSAEKLQLILIAEHALNNTELRELKAFNASIIRNFSLAAWYEIEIPSADVSRIKELKFVKDLAPPKKYGLLVNDTEIAEDKIYNGWILYIAILFFIGLFYFLRKRKTILILLFFLSLPVTLAGENFSEKIDQQILSDNSETITVIVEVAGNASLGYANPQELKEFQLGKFSSMKIEKSEISKLDKMASVKKVWKEKKYSMLLDVAVPLINTSNFLDGSYNGTGIKVCVLDTGINSSHLALSSRIVAQKDFVTTDSDGDTPEDFDGHGTHVAGIVASINSTFRGVAFGSSILNAKVFNSTDSLAPETAIMSGIDWCISNGAHILTLSLGASIAENDGSDSLSQYVDLAVDQGKVVTIAAGNGGPSSNTINCPGCAHKVISVGNTYKKSYSGVSWSGCTDSSPPTDRIACSSSRGPTADNRTSPDVTAPGALITSASLSGGWTDKGGTSMSTPVVAGLAALMLQARNITPEEVKVLMMNTAIDLGSTGKDNSYGAGRVNASKIFNEINNTAKASISNETRVHNIFVPSDSAEIRATLYWPENYSVHNNLDLWLLDPAGNVRASSLSVNNTDEMINFSSSFSGNWKLLINGSNGTQLYALASNFKPSEQMYLAVNNASRIVYHQINVTSSSRLTLNLDWNSSDVNMDLYLYNTTGALVNYSNATTTNYENISATGPTGIWMARVVANTTNVSYSLSSNFSLSQQILDAVPPNVTITGPLNATYPQNFTLAFNVIENLNAGVSCSMILDGSSTSLEPVYNNSPLVRNFSATHGRHNVSVMCSDSANNTGNSIVVNFTTDSIAPNITFVLPSDNNNTFVSRNYTFINVTVTDDNNIDSCTLEWGSANYTMAISSGYCYINKTDTDGTRTYKIYANDSLGNMNITQQTITIDTTKPFVANLNFTGGNNNTFSPNGDSIFDQLSFNITASETVNFSTTYLLAENGSRVKTFNKVDNTSSILKTWNGCFIQSCSTGFASDGTYRIEIQMTDRAGNANATNLSTNMILDTIPPQISFSSPTPNNETIRTGNTVIINITTSESPSSVLLEWNGTNETVNGASTSWFKTKSNLPDGNYTFRVYANDSVGNKNVTEIRWVLINTTRNLTSAISSINQTLAAKNITFELLNATGTAVDSSSLKSFEKYTLRFNQSRILIETADFLVGSLNTSAVLNITSNLTAEFNISSVFNQSGGILDSYVWIDLNNMLPAGNFTAKIVFPKIYALYFYLNGTKDAPNITRVTSVCNTNISNVPCYNISANASTLYLPSFSGGAGGNDTQAPSLSLSSPVATTYASSSISLSYTVNDNVAIDSCWFSLNGPNTTLANCTNTTITASQGSNTLVMYVNDTSSNINQTTVTFTFTQPVTTAPSGGGSSDNKSDKNQSKVIPNESDNKTVNKTESTTTSSVTTTIPDEKKINITAGTGLAAASPANFTVIGIAIISIAAIIGGYLFLKPKPKPKLRQIKLKHDKKRKKLKYNYKTKSK